MKRVTVLASVLLLLFTGIIASLMKSLVGDTLIAREDADTTSWGLAVLSENGKLTTSVTGGTYSFYPDSGKGVDVYVLDSGVNQINGLKGVNVVNEFKCDATPDFDDTYNHGTSVASIISSEDYGVAKKVNLYSYKVQIDTNEPDAGCTIQAFKQVISKVKERKTKTGYKGSIINLSSNLPASVDLERQVALAIGQGIAVVSTPGNENDNSALIYPCAYDDVICVGAMDNNYERWVDENRNLGSGNGAKVAIWAPGKDVTAYDNKGNVVSSLEGTSIAAPFVSGILATFYGWEGKSLTVDNARARLLANAESDLLSRLGPNSNNELANNGYSKAGKNDDKPYIDAPPAPSSAPPATPTPAPTTTTQATPTVTTPTPTPSESCRTKYDFFFDQFNVWGSDWDVSKLGTDGSGLKKHIGSCHRALTDWHFDVLSAADDPIIKFHAWGHLPISAKHCVTQAFEPAGGPPGICDGSD